MLKGQKRKSSLQERFDAKYKILENGCWEWTATKNREGYGRIMIFGRKFTIASRLSYVLHKGEIPEGIKVCHTCDFTSCVNPNHLFLGTDKDNIHDSMNKGRRPTAKHGVNHTLYLRGCRCELCVAFSRDHFYNIKRQRYLKAKDEKMESWKEKRKIYYRDNKEKINKTAKEKRLKLKGK